MPDSKKLSIACRSSQTACRYREGPSEPRQDGAVYLTNIALQKPKPSLFETFFDFA